MYRHKLSAKTPNTSVIILPKEKEEQTRDGNSRRHERQPPVAQRLLLIGTVYEIIKTI